MVSFGLTYTGFRLGYDGLWLFLFGAAALAIVPLTSFAYLVDSNHSISIEREWYLLSMARIRAQVESNRLRRAVETRKTLELLSIPDRARFLDAFGAYRAPVSNVGEDTIRIFDTDVPLEVADRFVELMIPNGTSWIVPAVREMGTGAEFKYRPQWEALRQLARVKYNERETNRSPDEIRASIDAIASGMLVT